MEPLAKWNPFRFEKYDPFKELDEINKRLTTMFGRVPVKGDGPREEALAVAEWAPLVDIAEDAKEFVIKADLPEVRKADVKVTVEGGVLTLTGERTFEKEEKDKKYHRVERAFGRFLRSFTLPEGVDAGKVVAEFKEGVLKVRVPKTEKSSPSSVEVKVE